ncbi:hypothetical protein Pint_12421 [Pistacia integerrima]|uniref:Uncharacterized protein n=1 Tax=Pistacia integerrima TaxID=434235 RepID=A0ACC0Y8H3_9ROSI|nr:hypothetical protein Pint_12421 [Pistacia integerrima]
MALKGAYECEHFEGDNRLRTVVATSKQKTWWINPATLKLRHRIGRGPFGETWLATLRGSREDYGEYHEVVVKMLHPVKEDHMRVLLDKLDDLFSKCQGVEGVCWLQGISAMNGKVCLVMKFYEGSVGDKMARHKGGKLSLSNAFRYIINLAQGILELHSKEILLLNLKPFNFLLDEYNQAIFGDVGIPFILLGIPLPSSDLARRIGTPNYMAPEQWQPEVRGPISFETDSWGFACSIVEMLTGVQPWCGKSAHEIYDAVVRKQKKPCIPSGLPPPIENVLLGCFEYDFRSRPLMTDILRVFKSLQNAVHSGGWTDLESIIPAEKSSSGYTEWFLSKDDLQVGDMVRSRKPANSCKPDNMDVPEGTVVGLEHSTERDGFVLVRVHGIHDPLRVHVSSLERVTFGFAAGDWVRMKEEDKRHSPVGILHSIHRDGNVAVGFIGLETLRKGKSSELQMAGILQYWICWVLPNGCLVVKFPGRIEEDYFLADPAEVEAVTFSTCPGMVKKYQHLEDHHWACETTSDCVGSLCCQGNGDFLLEEM